MDQEILKTSKKQRVFIFIIAVVMLGSIIASYAAIILASNNTDDTSTTTQSLSDEKMAKYEDEYLEAVQKISDVSSSYFDEFIQYKSEITAYNEASANSDGLVTKDLKVGSGRTLDGVNNDYLAFYVGWCADETIFDSSFDSTSSPTAFSSVLDASEGLIEGWELGIVDMKIGGIREITIPGELAYAETKEICGGYNKPLKFIVMAVEDSGDIADASDEFDLASQKLQYAYYGIDYDEMFGTGDDEEDEEEEE